MRSWLLRAFIGLWIVASAAGISITEAQQRDTEWLIRKPLEESVLHLSNLLTSQARYKEGDEVEGFVSFEIDRPAYVYLFNISPEEKEKVHLLLPNRSSPDNFFQPGDYTLQQTFPIPGPPGEAFIQAIATPLPLDLGPSSDEEFRFLGDDPALVFAGIRVLIEAKGLVAGDWAADWIHYGVESRVTRFSLPLECANVKIEVPQAQDKIVNLRIDKDCYNKEEIEREFIGPSYEFPFVLEGERTFTINVEGFEEASQTAPVEADRTNEIVFEDLKQAEYFAIEIEPLNPRVWEEVTFRAVYRTDQQIEKFIWDFGDGSPTEEGIEVTHVYRESAVHPYRVKLKAQFSGEDQPRTVGTAELSVSPIATGCPPQYEALTDIQEYADSIMISSRARFGCAKVEFPEYLINAHDHAIEGQAKFKIGYAWEELPEARIQAFLDIAYEDQTGNTIKREAPVPLLPVKIGEYSRDINLKVPSGAKVKPWVLLNIIENPDEEQLLLEVGPSKITLNTPCPGGRLEAFNPITEARGDLVSFRPDHRPVVILLKNESCPDIEVPENGIVIKRNGELIETLSIPSTTVKQGLEAAWDWDFQVEPGVYTIEVDTVAGPYSGIYTTRVIIARGEGSGA